MEQKDKNKENGKFTTLYYYYTSTYGNNCRKAIKSRQI